MSVEAVPDQGVGTAAAVVEEGDGIGVQDVVLVNIDAAIISPCIKEGIPKGDGPRAFRVSEEHILVEDKPLFLQLTLMVVSIFNSVAQRKNWSDGVADVEAKVVADHIIGVDKPSSFMCVQGFIPYSVTEVKLGVFAGSVIHLGKVFKAMGRAVGAVFHPGKCIMIGIG